MCGRQVKGKMIPEMLRPCCGFVAEMLRLKSLTVNAVSGVAGFQTSSIN